jgi:hypothetical protein
MKTAGKDRIGDLCMNKRTWIGALALMLAFAAVLAGCGGKKDSGGSASSGGADAAKTASAPKAGGKAAPASDFSYDLSEDGKDVVITKYTGKGGKVVIPGEIEGLPVVQLGGESFRNAGGRELTSVVIPATVKTISHLAFDGREKLTSVTFLGTEVKLGSHAFSSCTELSEVIFPDAENALISWDDEKWTVYKEETKNGKGTGKWSNVPAKATEGSAFYKCEKLPLAVRAKLNAMGFTKI